MLSLDSLTLYAAATKREKHSTIKYFNPKCFGGIKYLYCQVYTAKLSYTSITVLAAKDESEQFYILCLDHQFVQFKALDIYIINYP